MCESGARNQVIGAQGVTLPLDQVVRNRDGSVEPIGQQLEQALGVLLYVDCDVLAVAAKVQPNRWTSMEAVRHPGPR